MATPHPPSKPSPRANCAGPALLPPSARGERIVLDPDVVFKAGCRPKRSAPLWRYFSLYPCSRRLCLAFKTPMCTSNGVTRFQQHGIGANLVAMSVDGLNFSATAAKPLLPLRGRKNDITGPTSYALRRR